MADQNETRAHGQTFAVNGDRGMTGLKTWKQEVMSFSSDRDEWWACRCTITNYVKISTTKTLDQFVFYHMQDVEMFDEETNKNTIHLGHVFKDEHDASVCLDILRKHFPKVEWTGYKIVVGI